jgi:tetratricopeptide (TPR) repeat protein
MKKFLIILIVIAAAYLTAFYTSGKKNGYTSPFEFKLILKNLGITFETKTLSHFEKGLLLLNEENYDDALKEFLKASENENTGEINYYIGHSYLLKGDYKNALDFLNKAIELNSENEKAWLDKGITKYNQALYTDAINDLYFSTELKPDIVEAYYYLSLCYEAEQKFELALQSAETALRYDSLHINARFKAGYIAFDMDSFKIAKFHYLTLLKTNPNHQFALLNLGLTYNYLEQADSAEYYYNKVIDLYPEYGLAYNNKGYLYQKKEDYKTAIELYSTAIKYDNSNTRPIWNRGDCYFAEKQYQKAINDYKTVFEKNNSYYNTLYQIGESYEHLNKIADALSYYEQYKSRTNSEGVYYKQVNEKIKKLKKNVF